MNRFIAFDCVDSEEKTLQIEWLARSLKQNNYSVVVTKESIHTDLALRLGELISSDVTDDDSRVQMMMTVRAHHLRTVVEPSLAKGAWVICDRFSGSYDVLQAEMAYETWGCRVPDVTFHISLPGSTILSRDCVDESTRVERIFKIDNMMTAYAQYAQENHERVCVVDGTGTDDVVFTEIQDRILLGGRAPLRIPLYDMKAFRKLESESKAQTEYGVRLKGIVQKIADVGGKYRDLVVLPPDHVRLMDEFDATFPNFAEFSKFVRRHFSLTQLGDGRIALPPVLFLGEPGIGKTDAVLWLSNKLGNGGVVLDMASVQAGASIAGADAFWSNSKEGVLFEALAFGTTANPFLVLEEIDKVGDLNQYDPLAPFYSLLERKTAAKFTDLSIRNFSIDASHVQWVATANDMDSLPGPILKRFKTFVIPRPSVAQSEAIARNIYRRILSENSWGGFFAPEMSSSMCQEFGNLGLVPREMVAVITDAFGSAAERMSSSLELSDLNITSTEKPSIGFVSTASRTSVHASPVRKGPMPR